MKSAAILFYGDKPLKEFWCTADSHLKIKGGKTTTTATTTNVYISSVAISMARGKILFTEVTDTGAIFNI